MPRSETLRTVYARQGYVSPIPILSPGEADALLAKVNTLGAARGGRLPPALNMKAHLLSPALWALVHDSRILAPVRAILGDDVLCWGSSFFDKAPGEASHVPWHQDSTYWGLERPDALTAWVALTASTPQTGCLRVMPGTHGAQRDHRDAGDRDNMLPAGEVLCDAVDETAAVDIVLHPGEMSLHHQQIVHGSKPNRGTQRRIGFAIRYIAGDLRGVGRDRSYATLVSGRDHGGFVLETAPERDMDPAALRRHGRILRATHAIVRREVSARRPHKVDGAQP
ncbi:MAG: phytanoyl-CoA dioxygenase family protein [Oceanicaulis sp.]